MARSSPARATRGDAVFAQTHTSKQLLFAELEQLVVALIFFVKESSSKLALRWRLRCVAGDAVRCQSRGTPLACYSGVLGVLLVDPMARWKQQMLRLTCLPIQASHCRRRPCGRRQRGEYDTVLA